MVLRPSLTKVLRAAAERSEAAARNAGLSFFEVVFEMLDAADVNAVAAYGGFPVRYASWRFGMEFERLSRGYDWGLSKIYELVVNHDPTIAYLVRSNSLMEQKLVMAHVFGHADFFKNNAWFAPTDRRMLDRFEEHARRIQLHVEAQGQERVERFLDAALGLEPLMDPFAPLRTFRAEEHRAKNASIGSGRSGAARSGAALEALFDGSARPEPDTQASLDLPTFDILPFLVDHASRLEPWERDLLVIVRTEAEYFLPQRMTKIINEGWASFWHSKLLTGGLLDASEVVEFADCHSGATAAAPGQLNPYKLGIELFRHAEESGLDLFRLRSVHNDISFIDEVMDEAFTARSSLFVIQRGGRGKAEGPRIGSRAHDVVKESLLKNLAWGGQPRIQLTGIDAGALVLDHDHDGRDLKLDDAGEMLRTIERIWRHPVTLRTREGDEPRRLIVENGDVRMLEGDGGTQSSTAKAG